MYYKLKTYRQVEASFSQPNSGIAAQMLSWAQDVTRGSEGHDLLGEITQLSLLSDSLLLM